MRNWTFLFLRAFLPDHEFTPLPPLSPHLRLRLYIYPDVNLLSASYQRISCPVDPACTVSIHSHTSRRNHSNLIFGDDQISSPLLTLQYRYILCPDWPLGRRMCCDDCDYSIVTQGAIEQERATGDLEYHCLMRLRAVGIDYHGDHNDDDMEGAETHSIHRQMEMETGELFRRFSTMGVGCYSHMYTVLCLHLTDLYVELSVPVLCNWVNVARLMEGWRHPYICSAKY